MNHELVITITDSKGKKILIYRAITDLSPFQQPFTVKTEWLPIPPSNER